MKTATANEELKYMVEIHIDSIKNSRKILENVIANSIYYDTLTRALMFDFYDYNSRTDTMNIYSYVTKLEIGDTFFLKSQGKIYK